MRQALRITYLGTGAAEGIPGLFCSCPLCTAARKNGGKDVRTRSQALINEDLLIDFPADTYSHSIDMRAVRYLLVTHSHQDHFYPEDLCLRSKAFSATLDGAPLKVFGNETVCSRWEETWRREYPSFDYSGIEFYCIKSFDSFSIGPYRVKALPANHKRSEECLIYDIGYEGSRLLYANDTGIKLDPAVFDHFSTVHYDIVSMDCTGMDKRVGSYHMGVADNVDFIAALKECGSVDGSTLFVSTHFSHFGQLDHEHLSALLSGHGIITAYDGFKLETGGAQCRT